MNKEIDIIQVDGYYLIGVYKETPIKEGDWCYNAHAIGHPKYTDEIIAKASKNAEVNWANNMSYNDGKTFLRDNYFKVIAHNGHPALADSGLPLLPEVEEDVAQLAEKEYDKEDDFKVNNYTVEAIMKNIAIDFYQRGYKAASKGFAENDVRKAIEMARTYADSKTSDYDHYDYEVAFLKKYTPDEIIRSLRPVPKRFVMEMERYHRPRINTRDGKTYLVGTYKF